MGSKSREVRRTPRAVARHGDHPGAKPPVLAARPEDALIAIEASDTTLAYDENVKLPLYAEFKIPEVWIAVLTSELIERRTQPSESGYRLTTRAKKGGTLASETLPGPSVAMGEILA